MESFYNPYVFFFQINSYWKVFLSLYYQQLEFNPQCL